MLYSLLTNSGVEILGGMLFFISAIFIIKDKLLCERESNAGQSFSILYRITNKETCLSDFFIITYNILGKQG